MKLLNQTHWTDDRWRYLNELIGSTSRFIDENRPPEDESPEGFGSVDRLTHSYMGRSAKK